MPPNPIVDPWVGGPIRLFAALLLAFSGLSHRAAAFDHEYSHYAKVLTNHVHEGWVNYQAIKTAPADLDDALDDFASVNREEFETWKEPERLAFLLNLYNASTLKLIVDNHPVKSIKSIGGFFSTPWRQQVVHAFAETVTLDDVEHRMIRTWFKEPRVHFALVCAARSCPPLRSEPYVGRRLDTQLDDQGRQFMAQPEKNRYDPVEKILWLSPIFRWFESDFTSRKRSVAEFVIPYLPKTNNPPAMAGSVKIKYTAYDWSLNEQPAAR